MDTLWTGEQPTVCSTFAELFDAVRGVDTEGVFEADDPINLKLGWIFPKARRAIYLQMDRSKNGEGIPAAAYDMIKTMLTSEAGRQEFRKVLIERAKAA